jgi:hypothetical protein
VHGAEIEVFHESCHVLGELGLIDGLKKRKNLWSSRFSVRERKCATESSEYGQRIEIMLPVANESVAESKDK